MRYVVVGTHQMSFPGLSRVRLLLFQVSPFARAYPKDPRREVNNSPTLSPTYPTSNGLRSGRDNHNSSVNMASRDGQRSSAFTHSHSRTSTDIESGVPPVCSWFVLPRHQLVRTLAHIFFLFRISSRISHQHLIYVSKDAWRVSVVLQRFGSLLILN